MTTLLVVAAVQKCWKFYGRLIVKNDLWEK